MLDTSHFEPGTILWLPKLCDIPVPRFDTVNTVPHVCFGHPVLVLAIDSLDYLAIILILTTFGGSGPLPAKIYGRGQELYDYLPIHPAKRHISVIPSLLLHPSQKLTRDNWVYVREPYRCPKAWLQETWDQNWLLPHLSRKITTKSIHSLVLYARSKGYDPGVYNILLRQYGAPLPRAMSATNTLPVDPLGRSYRRPNLYSLSSERTSLLPYTVDRRTVPYGTPETPETKSKHWLRYLGTFICCVFLCALIGGLGYGIYAGVKCTFALWKHKIWPAVILLWEKVVKWIKGL